MAKKIPDTTYDKDLEHTRDNMNQMLICSGEPTDRANAIALALVTISMAPGDYTIGAGTPDGRAITMAAKTNQSIATSGTANHVVLISPTELGVVTTTSPQALTAGGTVNTNAWTWTKRAPT